ncbi:MAG: stage II sporulation protein D [Candidatus Metalachnospira sp.]|nr:stage II sporulation protein D [Candidatus Metalachnospira sp.]
MKKKRNVVGKYILLSQLYVFTAVVAVPCTFAKIYDKATEIIVSHEIKTSAPAEKENVNYKVGGVDIDDYIKGVVAAEMPVSFPLEALKAQAVASRTYAVRAVENADKDLEPKDIGQAYIDVDGMKKNWGDNFDTYYAKISQAVDDTDEEIMVYDGEPILAVFHSTSAGETETAGNIWNYDLPYLVSTDSEGDKYAPNYEVSANFTPEQIIEKIKAKYSDFSADASTLFDTITINQRSEAGYITEITVGNKNFTGKEIREALGLRSTDFTVAKNGDNIVITTKGFGHGAGMSQYGAKYMADNGCNYKTILNHYYKDIAIGNLDEKSKSE